MDLTGRQIKVAGGASCRVTVHYKSASTDIPGTVRVGTRCGAVWIAKLLTNGGLVAVL